MARRALIIGLGSNGYEVCDWLTRRIQWEYGGLDKTPWLKVLCLETAEVARGGVLGENSFHIKIDETDYAAMRDTPGRYADTLDLERWTDARTMSIPSAITNGAMNIRMMGRLAFLFSKNLERIRSEIKDRLDALGSLTEAEAKQRRGVLPDGSDPSIDLSDQTWVYVVGTLAGGTCSGAFIDLGYFLFEEFKNIGSYNIVRTGIFALPHPGYDPMKWRRRRANVFAALTELNHFSTRGKTYSAQYPIRKGRRTVIHKTLPYDFCYLLQPSGATDPDYNRLKVAVAQYLHTDVFTEQSDDLEPGKLSERDAARVDVSDELDKDDLKESPQKYFTFGMSAIEFPAYLVAQACCYKLCHEAFSSWLETRDLSPVDLETARRKSLNIAPDAIAAKLLEMEAPSYEKRMQDAISNALGGKISVSELARVEDAIGRSVTEGQGGGDADIDSALQPGAVVGHVRGRRFAPVLDSYKDAVSTHIQSSLTSMANGPDYCRRLLESLDGWLTGRIAQIESSQAQTNRSSAIDGAHDNLEMARDRLGACLNDPVLGFMGAGIGKGMAVKKYAAEYEAAAHDYISWRLKGLIEPEEAKIWKEILAWVRVLQTRVSAAETGIAAQGEALRDLFAAKLKELDDTVPAINGKVLFEPGKTVNETYNGIWSHKSAEEREKAKSELVAAWPALPQIDINTGQVKDADTYFQSTLAPVTPGQQKAALERAVTQITPRARRHFGEVFRVSVFDRITPDDADALRDVMDKSRVMLDLGKHLNDRYENTGTKGVGLVFFEGAGSITGDAETKPKTFWQTLGAVRTGADVLKPVSARDRQSILFLREEAAFSLPIVRGLREGEASFEDDFQDQSQQTTIHARKDIPQWEPLYGSLDAEAPHRKALCLMGMALPRAAATVMAPPVNGSQGTSGETLTNSPSILRRAAQPKPEAAFIYDLDPPLPPRTQQMEFPDDLKGAALLLRNFPELQLRLQEDILKVRSQSNPETMVANILRFTSGIERLGIKENEAIVDEKRAFDLLTQFWKNDPEMIRAFEDGYRPDESALNRMWQDAQPGFPFAGYYCECPNHFLLGQEKKDIPARCPREGCSRYLRWAGIQPST